MHLKTTGTDQQLFFKNNKSIILHLATFKIISMRITIIFLLLSSVIFFSSCSKLPVYNSQEYVANKEEGFINPLSANFDKKNNISYGVANDTIHFYVQAIFRERESFMKIMRGGLTVYFDQEGKKKKKYQLKIEKSQVQLTEYEMMTRQGNRNLNNPQQNMPATIDIMFNKVTWDKDGDKLIFYRNLQHEPIAVNLGPNKHNELILKIKIPLTELSLSEDTNLFSVGIESGSISMGNMSGQKLNAGMSGGGSRGGGSRSGRGGRGRGGMSGGKSGGGSRPGSSPQSGMQPIKLWFQVQL